MAEQTKSGTPEVWAAGIGRKSRAEYGSDLMAEMLRELGIKYIALNPGASYRGLHDSIVNFEGENGPQMILCTHEEIAVGIANGYARVTGEIMATGLHDIVGLQHASMNLFNAWCDRTPIFNLGGGGPLNTTNRRSTDWVHTALIQGNMVREFVKYDDQPNSVDAVPESFLKAYRIAMTEPKGPVYVCLDTDVQEAKITTPMIVPDARLFRPPAAPGPNPEELNRAAQLLAGADWPLIVAGEAGEKSQSFAGTAGSCRTAGRAGHRLGWALCFSQHPSIEPDHRAGRSFARCRRGAGARRAEPRRAHWDLRCVSAAISFRRLALRQRSFTSRCSILNGRAG